MAQNMTAILEFCYLSPNLVAYLNLTMTMTINFLISSASIYIGSFSILCLR